MKTLIISLFFFTQAFAQEYGINTGIQYSYSGFSGNTGLELKFDKVSLEAGFKMPLHQSFKNIDKSFGAYTCYNWLIRTEKAIEPFARIQYEIVFNKIAYLQSAGTSTNKLHELYFCYGFKYRIIKNLSIKNGIGVGGYYEKFYDEKENEIINQQGTYTKVFITANYSF